MLGIAVEYFEHLKPINPRNIQVDEQQIGPKPLNHHQGVDAVVHHLKHRAHRPSPENGLVEQTQVGVVFSHQHPQGAARRHSDRRRGRRNRFVVQHAVDGFPRDAAVSAWGFPGFEQTGVYPQLHCAHRNRQNLGCFAGGAKYFLLL